MIPKMIVVAGPPGSGKSTLYPVSSFGVSYFNADDRAAELNGGPYVSISNEIRKIVNCAGHKRLSPAVVRFGPLNWLRFFTWVRITERSLKTE